MIVIKVTSPATEYKYATAVVTKCLSSKRLAQCGILSTALCNKLILSLTVSASASRKFPLSELSERGEEVDGGPISGEELA